MDVLQCGESLVHSASCVASFMIVVVKCMAVECSGISHNSPLAVTASLLIDPGSPDSVGLTPSDPPFTKRLNSSTRARTLSLTQYSTEENP